MAPVGDGPWLLAGLLGAAGPAHSIYWGLDGYLYQSLSLNILLLLHTVWLLCGVAMT
jgi:hypothetical protein